MATANHSQPSALYQRQGEGKAPVMITYLYGALDAGSAAQMAVYQVLASLPSRRIATFDSDELIDYRSRRPLSSMRNWVIDDFEMPEIALDLVTDFRGNQLLVLHGPEPDLKWRAFGDAVAELAEAAEVKVSYDLAGMPAALPHTRSSLVHETGVESTDLPPQLQQPQSVSFMCFAGAYLQGRLSKVGIRAKGLLVGVPYYLADERYSPAAVALLQHIAGQTGLELPIGDLESYTSAIEARLRELAAESDDLQQLVGALEEAFDNAQVVITGPEDDEPSSDESDANGFDLSQMAAMVSLRDWVKERNAKDKTDSAISAESDLIGRLEEFLTRVDDLKRADAERERAQKRPFPPRRSRRSTD